MDLLQKYYEMIILRKFEDLTEEQKFDLRNSKDYKIWAYNMYWNNLADEIINNIKT